MSEEIEATEVRQVEEPVTSVEFDKADDVFAVIKISATTTSDGNKINNFIFGSMTFYDHAVANTWAVREGFKTPFVYFYNKVTHNLPIGLIPRVSSLLRKRFGTKICLTKAIRDIYTPPKGLMSRDDVLAYAATLKLHNLREGFEIKPYEHQLKLVERALNGRRISLLACTSAGKSLSMCIISRYLLERERKKILVIVPSTNLVEQLFSDFHDDYGWEDARKYCTLIYADSDDKLTKAQKERLAAAQIGEEVMLKPITISTWQSLQNKPAKFFETFTAVIVDEAHSTRGIKLRDILMKCTNAVDFKIGVSGTLPDDGIDAGYIESQLGRKEEIVRLKELVEKGILTPVTVNAIFIPYPQALRRSIGYSSFDDERAFCSSTSSRRDVMKLLIDSNKITTEQNTVILFKAIENLELMHDFLVKNFPQFTYHIIKGDVSVDEREEIRKSIEYSTGHMILATYGCMKQGVNIKLLHNLVMADPAKSVYMVMQSIGRIVRPHKDKKMAYVYDLVDDASYFTTPRRGGPPRLKYNYMMQHYETRKTYYAKDDIPINEIRLDGIYEATIDEEMIAERKKKAAEKARKKNEKKVNKTGSVFKSRFFG